MRNLDDLEQTFLHSLRHAHWYRNKNHWIGNDNYFTEHMETIELWTIQGKVP